MYIRSLILIIFLILMAIGVSGQQINTVSLDPIPPISSIPSNTPQSRNIFCEGGTGENYSISITRPIAFIDLINVFRQNFNVNLVLDQEIQQLPINYNVENVPWTSILRMIMELNELEAKCIDGGKIVLIAKRSKLAEMENQRRLSSPLQKEVFRLRYIQQTSGSRVNAAGQQTGSSNASIQSLEDAIRDILQSGSDKRASVRRVPGRNELIVSATRDQIEDVRQLIERFDRPAYQVKLSALMYTVNETKLRDIGSQLNVILGNAQQTDLGGISTLAGGSNQGSGSSAGNSAVGRVPSGVGNIGQGFSRPANVLQAANPAGIFGVTTIIGTAQFNYQLSLAKQNGAINVQSRPFGIVGDGEVFDLTSGTQIPVALPIIAGGSVTPTGQLQFVEASRIAQIVPQVAELEDGKPGFVTLTLRLENNSVDTSIASSSTVAPPVNRQSLQTVLRLRNGETAIVGGLTADSVSHSSNKVPGLSAIPLLGNLFKRQTDQENRDRLYFAITAEVIQEGAPLKSAPVPTDATTEPPPAPEAQKPGPYNRSQKK
jgi:type IV pilus assembly protein PilQ